MTDNSGETDRSVAAFMRRVADAHGASEAAPDPAWLWLRARLESRREREERASNARTLSVRLVTAALVLSAFVAIRFSWPLIAELGNAAIVTGVTLAALVPLIWFLGIRPLRNER